MIVWFRMVVGGVMRSGSILDIFYRGVGWVVGGLDVG